MANANNPHGLRPLGICTGGGQPQIEWFGKLSSYGTAIYRNDAVSRVSGGSLQVAATPGTTVLSGVALQYAKPSVDVQVAVMITPEAIYEAQVNGSLALTDMGLNANLLYTTGNTSTKMSKHEIDASTKAVTATLDVHLLGLNRTPTVRNDYGTNAKLEVVINKHRMGLATAGV